MEAVEWHDDEPLCRDVLHEPDEWPLGHVEHVVVRGDAEVGVGQGEAEQSCVIVLDDGFGVNVLLVRPEEVIKVMPNGEKGKAL